MEVAAAGAAAEMVSKWPLSWLKQWVAASEMAAPGETWPTRAAAREAAAKERWCP